MFDELPAVLLGELAEEAVHEGRARVVSVQDRPKSKWKPLPLTTVELQKSASRFLKMSSHECMEIAERLYTKGFISYPRTDTDTFPADMGLEPIVAQQTTAHGWGPFAAELCSGSFRRPRGGQRSDEAHPPIHPTKAAGGPQAVGGDRAWQLYEFVTRRFLACCSDDARGVERCVVAEAGGESFVATGLVVTEENYLRVYPYDRWGDAAGVLPDLGAPGTVLSAARTRVVVRESATTPPTLLTEADLIALMDRERIGTDATIADHIKTVQDRKYVFKQGDFFVPSSLGMALYRAYEAMGAPLGKPYLRREMERDCDDVAQGRKDRSNIVRECIAHMRPVFDRAERGKHTIIAAVRAFLQDPDSALQELAREFHARGGGAGAPGNDDDDDDDEHYDDEDDGPPDGPAGGGGKGKRVGGRFLAPDQACRPISGGDPGSGRGRGAGGSGGGGGGGGGGRSGGGGGVGEDGGEAGYRPSSTGMAATGTGPPTCRKHQETCLEQRVRTGANAGRRFWCCPRTRDNDSCGFTAWLDDTADGSTSSFAAAASSSSSNSSSISSKSYGGDGLASRGAASASASSFSSASALELSPSRRRKLTCSACGQEGHSKRSMQCPVHPGHAGKDAGASAPAPHAPKVRKPQRRSKHGDETFQ